jgi:uncharacterized membrane protein
MMMYTVLYLLAALGLGLTGTTSSSSRDLSDSSPSLASAAVAVFSFVLNFLGILSSFEIRVPRACHILPRYCCPHIKFWALGNQHNHLQNQGFYVEFMIGPTPIVTRSTIACQSMLCLLLLLLLTRCYRLLTQILTNVEASCSRACF